MYVDIQIWQKVSHVIGVMSILVYLVYIAILNIIASLTFLELSTHKYCYCP